MLGFCNYGLPRASPRAPGACPGGFNFQGTWEGGVGMLESPWAGGREGGCCPYSSCRSVLVEGGHGKAGKVFRQTLGGPKARTLCTGLNRFLQVHVRLQNL